MAFNFNILPSRKKNIANERIISDFFEDSHRLYMEVTNMDVKIVEKRQLKMIKERLRKLAKCSQKLPQSQQGQAQSNLEKIYCGYENLKLMYAAKAYSGAGVQNKNSLGTDEETKSNQAKASQNSYQANRSYNNPGISLETNPNQRTTSSYDQNCRTYTNEYNDQLGTHLKAKPKQSKTEKFSQNSNQTNTYNNLPVISSENLNQITTRTYYQNSRTYSNEYDSQLGTDLETNPNQSTTEMSSENSYQINRSSNNTYNNLPGISFETNAIQRLTRNDYENSRTYSNKCNNQLGTDLETKPHQSITENSYQANRISSNTFNSLPGIRFENPNQRKTNYDYQNSRTYSNKYNNQLGIDLEIKPHQSITENSYQANWTSSNKYNNLPGSSFENPNQRTNDYYQNFRTPSNEYNSQPRTSSKIKPGKSPKNYYHGGFSNNLLSNSEKHLSKMTQFPPPPLLSPDSQLFKKNHNYQIGHQPPEVETFKYFSPTQSSFQSYNNESSVSNTHINDFHQLEAEPSSRLDVDDDESSPEEPEILDVHEFFKDDFNPDMLNIPKESLEFIVAIENEAEKLLPKIETFSGDECSLDYFVLDEKLMRLIEHLDKVVSHDKPQLQEKKVEVILRIKQLHQELDSRLIT